MAMAKRFKAMRGTHDILPEEAHLWRRIENAFVTICGRCGYGEIRIPVFEATELFERGTGFATDVVQKEMYTFADKKGRSLTLRPEATPSVIRSYLESNLGRRGKAIKLFYMGPMFRYDRPGAGRYRQFHQLGIEVIGTPSPAADAETIRLLWEYLVGIGLGNLRIRLNSLGCTDCRVKYSALLKDFLKDNLERLCPDCVERFGRNPLRVLDCKNKACKVVIEEAPDITTILCVDCVGHFERVRRYLDVSKIDFYVDPKLVRGLDYYTRTVFEVVHAPAGVDLALGGGGRYDRLVEEIGGPSTPAVGFSLGLERVVQALKEEGVAPGGESRPDVYVASIGEEASDKAFDLAWRLRNAFKVWMEFEQRKLEGQLRTASRLGARYTVILGPDEVKQGVAKIKDMESGDQTVVDYGEVASWLSGKLGG
jgi:histidyl-tRNA synthetase